MTLLEDNMAGMTLPKRADNARTLSELELHPLDAMAPRVVSALLQRPREPKPEQTDEWRPIPGWPEYEVSPRGRVRRVAPACGAVVGFVLKPMLNRKTGYLSVVLSRRSAQKRIDIHRLVALAFCGPQPSSAHLVAHNDGSRTNNCADNLRWATQRENILDCRRHGTALIGPANPMAKLDAIDRVAIHRMKAFGIPRPVIAAGFGVHKRTIFEVLAASVVEQVR
ncbi:MAG: hypothetical protein GC191_21050 [Azospirillum sp.]|nr:hypothetical protein [Azospirillum sp.]